MRKRAAIAKPEIPQYPLEGFRPVHRQEEETADFGYNTLDKTLMIPGFELYSSVGLKSSMGPLKSTFYRISITICGTVEVQLGLEHFVHRPGTVGFTALNQVFSKKNISDDLFGYYILFNPGFLSDLVPAGRITEEFPFFDYNGVAFFQLDASEINQAEQFVLTMNNELRQARPGREKAITLYLYLLLLEMKRSYDRQQLHVVTGVKDASYLVTRFQKLVSKHFLEQRKVTDYATMLGVTANHLNRVVKEVTGHTASDSITEMLVREARAVLKYTDASVAAIGYQLNFSDPAAFSRFFKKETGTTPQAFRENV